jgi:hypothetical protein
MMLGCEHNRAHAGILGKLSDLIGIEVHRLEFIGCLGIPVRKYSCKRLDLFAISLTYRFTVPYTSKMGIKSEVDEHGVFVIQPIGLGIDGQNRKQSGQYRYYDPFHTIAHKHANIIIIFAKNK